MIALALALLLQREPLPAYADAGRCAGLSVAHHRALDDKAPQSRVAYDTALFWSLAFSERARKDKVAAVQFEKDLAAEAERAGKQLAAKEPGATAELARCAARVPH